MQCQATTLNNTQCSRKTNSNYCWQHQKSINSPKITSINSPKNISISSPKNNSIPNILLQKFPSSDYTIKPVQNFKYGTIYSVNVDKGVNRNLSINFDDYSLFMKGDTIQVKLANIDKATYDFWRTLEYNYQSIGNPFSSPIRVLSNISNGALGYFGGYAAEYRELVIPK